MSVARIYRPAKTAMQSGQGQTQFWRLDYEPAEARFIEPLMGWTGSRSTKGQLSLEFDSREEAIAYAERQSIPYQIEEERPHRLRRRAYADNFAFNRLK